MSDSIRQHILKTLDSGVRFDGRKLHEFRKIVVEKNATKNAEGSAQVYIGDTQVLAGVKLAVEKPYPDTPDSGNLMVNAELLPLSNPNYEPGPPSIDSIDVARVIDRGIRESKVLDIKKLCLAPAESVWSVMIDVCTLNASGNIRDACALAAVVAVKNTKMPKFENNVVDYHKITNDSLPLSAPLIPISITVLKIGKHLVVDPLQEEEEVADARLTVAVIADGSIVALQKGGDHPLSADDIDKMVELAKVKSKELRKLI